jgi:hypothetical protein
VSRLAAFRLHALRVLISRLALCVMGAPRCVCVWLAVAEPLQEVRLSVLLFERA